MIGRTTLGTAVLNAANALLALAASVLLARALGPEGFGTYAFVVSIALVLAAAIRLGLPPLAVREVAKYQVEARWTLLRGFLIFATRASLTAGALALCAAAAWTLADPRIGVVGLLCALLASLIAVNSLWSGALRALQRVLAGHFTSEALVTGALAVFAACAIAAGALTSTTALMLHVAAAATGLAAAAWLLWRAFPAAVRAAAPSYAEAQVWRRSAMTLLAISGLQMVNTQADILLLGVLATSEDVGLYRAAVQGSHLVAFALHAVNVALAPSISRLHASGDHAALQRAATWSARVVLLVALPVAGVLIALGAPLLVIAFGEPFRAAYLPLAILCAGQLVSCLLGSVGLLLNMTGHERVTARAFAWGAGANIALNAVLIPAYGTTGAAIATSTTLVLWNVALCRQVWRRLGIQSMAFRLPLSARA